MNMASSIYELPKGVTSAEVIFELSQTWPTLRQIEKEEIVPKAGIAFQMSEGSIELMRVAQRKSRFFANFPVRVIVIENQAGRSLELSYALRWSDCFAELIVIGVLIFLFFFVPERPLLGVFAGLALLQWPWILYRHYRRVCSGVEAVLEGMANKAPEDNARNVT